MERGPSNAARGKPCLARVCSSWRDSFAAEGLYRVRRCRPRWRRQLPNPCKAEPLSGLRAALRPLRRLEPEGARHALPLAPLSSRRMRRCLASLARVAVLAALLAQARTVVHCSEGAPGREGRLRRQRLQAPARLQRRGRAVRFQPPVEGEPSLRQDPGWQVRPLHRLGLSDNRVAVGAPLCRYCQFEL